jgi:hypothetical protein
MPFGFMNGCCGTDTATFYTPHAGSMIIQVQTRDRAGEPHHQSSANDMVALLRVLGSRISESLRQRVFLMTWLLFTAQSVRVPVLSGRFAQLDATNRRIDSLQVALSRMHGRYEQVRQMLATVGGVSVKTAGADRHGGAA